MKDIPIFTTLSGTASLILREIPYKGCAYVVVRSVFPGGLDALLEECAAFCTQAGAERVLASADEPVEKLPHVHDILLLTRTREGLAPPERPVELTPVTAENGETYQALYNRLFFDVPNAATCRRAELEKLIARKSGFLALSGGVPAGLGELWDGELRALGVSPEFRGMGRPLALTLLGRLPGPVLELRTSSANERALRLYARIGFRVERVLSRWYLLKPGIRG